MISANACGLLRKPELYFLRQIQKGCSSIAWSSDSILKTKLVNSKIFSNYLKYELISESTNYNRQSWNSLTMIEIRFFKLRITHKFQKFFQTSRFDKHCSLSSEWTTDFVTRNLSMFGLIETLNDDQISRWSAVVLCACF